MTSAHGHEKRFNERRRLADRRGAAARRSGLDRRRRQRRRVAQDVGTERRSGSERRASERRDAGRRLNPTRRLRQRRAVTSGGKRVMVVEADRLMRSSLLAVLTKAGFQVVEASDAESALRAFWETPVDLVVTSLVLPRMDGVEFIRQLSRGFPEARIVAVAGRRRYGAPDPLAAVQTYRSVVGLRKPFSPDDLLRVARESLAAVNRGSSPRP